MIKTSNGLALSLGGVRPGKKLIGSAVTNEEIYRLRKNAALTGHPVHRCV
ncbi:MAG: hypothetical protein MR966_06370 [Lachnospiraceae bacterium]|nr:hypothetical protein [Lachnospiraceae bacterium]